MSESNYRQQNRGGHPSYQQNLPAGYTQGGGMWAPVGTAGHYAPYNPQTAPNWQGNWPGYNPAYGNPQGQQAQNTAVAPYYTNAQNSRGYEGNPASDPRNGGQSHPERRSTTHEPQHAAAIIHRVNGNSQDGVVKGVRTRVTQQYCHGDASENPTPLPNLEPVFDRHGNPVNVIGTVTGNSSSAMIMEGAHFTQNYLPRRSHTADVASNVPVMDQGPALETQRCVTEGSSSRTRRFWKKKSTRK